MWIKCGKVPDKKGQSIEDDCHTHLTLKYSFLSQEASEVAIKGSCSVEVHKIAFGWGRQDKMLKIY